MNLEQIVVGIKNILLENNGNTATEISSICCDSRKVVSGSLFIAIKGYQFDGDDFIGEAIQKGAVAIASESSLSLSVPCLKVSNSYQALSKIAEIFYGEPAREIDLIGVTGTNGKSSTVYILDAIFSEAGITTGMIGTICNRINGRDEKASFTTPDALSLQSIFSKMKESNVEKLSMEVSSHALAQYRVGSIPFKTALFTNLSQDHLDYHKSMDCYFEAKRKLFSEFLHESGKAIINIDDDYGEKLAESIDTFQLVSVGQEPEAYYRIANISYTRTHSEFTLVSKDLSLTLKTQLTGEFNIYNVALSVVAALENGVQSEVIIRALENFKGVPGRLELMLGKKGQRVFVDYAHTPDALEKVLLTLKGKGERLFCLFGCGGDRDKTKRPLMASVVEKYADKIWVTDDNPRTEESAQIIEDIKAGFKTLEKVKVQADRYKSIYEAIEDMNTEDVLLVAGKGHEDYQIYGNEKKYFCDRSVVKEILEKVCA